jgi:hypothetical protein
LYWDFIIPTDYGFVAQIHRTGLFLMEQPLFSRSKVPPSADHLIAISQVMVTNLTFSNFGKLTNQSFVASL